MKCGILVLAMVLVYAYAVPLRVKRSDEDLSGLSNVDCSLEGRQRRDSDVHRERVILEDGRRAIIVTRCVVVRRRGRTVGRSVVTVRAIDPNGGTVNVAAGTSGTCEGDGCSSKTTGSGNVETDSNGGTAGKARSVTHTKGDRDADVTVSAAGAASFE